MLEEVFYSPYFGVGLAIVAFQIGVSVSKRWKTSLANPLLIATIFVVCFLKLLHIPIAAFMEGGDLISLFLAPATAALAVPIYKNLQVLKQNILPVVIGTLVGSLSSMIVIFFLCHLFGLSDTINLSMLSKSTTLPIAIGVTEQLGGIVPITIVCVIFTGIFGSISAPWLIKLFHIHDAVAQGVAIGTSSHAVGTTKAVQLGELQGAMSGIAMGLAGLFTVFWALLLLLLI